VRHDDDVVDAAGWHAVPPVGQVEDVATDDRRPDPIPVGTGVVVRGLRHLQDAAVVQRDVAAGQPVEQRPGLIAVVGDEAVHRNRAVHDHGPHVDLLRLKRARAV